MPFRNHSVTLPDVHLPEMRLDAVAALPGLALERVKAMRGVDHSHDHHKALIIAGVVVLGAGAVVAGALIAHHVLANRDEDAACPCLPRLGCCGDKGTTQDVEIAAKPVIADEEAPVAAPAVAKAAVKKAAPARKAPAKKTVAKKAPVKKTTPAANK